MVGCTTSRPVVDPSHGSLPPPSVFSPISVPVPAVTARADVILLGEVHDNASQHAIRAHWLRELLAERRFVLVIEQLDIAMQSQIDAARDDGASARQLAARAGFRFDGWQWSFYEPYIQMAIDFRSPLHAGNLTAAEVMAIARGQRSRPALFDAKGVDWRSADQAQMLRALDEGHCGRMPAQALERMAVAQRARDAGIAQVVIKAHQRTGLPVVVLAGNGHVRNDIGVPRYLRAGWPQARIAAIGFEERHAEGQRAVIAMANKDDRYDQTVVTAAQPRPDPCAIDGSDKRVGAQR